MRLSSSVVNTVHYEPPVVSKPGLVWRIAVAALLSLAALIAAAAPPQAARPGLFTILDPAAGLLSWVIVFWRRRWPTVAAVVTGGLSGFSFVSVGPATWALFSLATTRRWPRYLVAALVTVGASLAYAPAVDPSMVFGWPSGLFTITALLGWGALIAAWGGQVGARRELLWTLRDRAERAEAERDLRADQARSRERERIAREMHDQLAHRISQISMHAGAMAFRTDLPPEKLTESAQTIRHAAHQALAELRDMLGVLRTDRVGAEPGQDSVRRLPIPTVGALPELIASSQNAGMNITADLDDEVISKTPDRIGRTIYRVVQEGLTNVTRHAAGAAVQIAVHNESSGSSREIVVVIHNDAGIGPAPSAAPAAPAAASELPESGFGLTGLQERVEMLDGTIEAGPRAGGYLLRARLPWTGEHAANPDSDRG